MSDSQEWSDGLRAIADLFDGNESEHRPVGGETFNIFVDSADELLGVAREIGGTWDKDTLGSWYILRRNFGPHSIELNASRENVCKQVEVGVETVMVPDPDAPKIEVTRPIYEWECPESLASLTSE